MLYLITSFVGGEICMLAYASLMQLLLFRWSDILNSNFQFSTLTALLWMLNDDDCEILTCMQQPVVYVNTL